jgi:protein-S-isoprenylcysteine O-methyltransferase Ste14
MDCFVFLKGVLPMFLVCHLYESYAMSVPEVPGSQQPEKTRYPRWAAPIYLTVLFLLVHVAAPWGISTLSSRYGWVDGRPGGWNLLALLLVVGPGIAGTLWLIIQHYRASPHTFLELKVGKKLITPGLYAFSRNPMYLSELTFWFGWALFYGSIPVLIAFLLGFAAFNFAVVPYEERDLEKRFGEAYRQYKQAVPRWLGKRRN